MKKLFFTVLTVLSSACLVQATHMSGSDMEFKLMSRDTLKVLLRVYRDCNGIPVNTSPQITLATVGCTPAKTASVTMTQTLVRPVRFMCGSQTNICEGGSFPFGMEEHRFEVTIALQQVFSGGLDSTCCELNLAYQECCRNGAITNIQPANFYIDATVNRCLKPYNTTPRFLNEPVTILCAGQPTQFNNGIIDTVDHDSIAIEMADPLLGPNSPSSWLGSYTKDKPFQFLGFPNATLPFPAGFHLNPVTGDLSFTPNAIQQPVAAFLIKEYALISGNRVLISTTRRDVQFFTYGCPANTPPDVAVNGNTNGPFSFIACATSPFCLSFKGVDVDTTVAMGGPDTTVLSLTAAPTGSTFSHLNTATTKVTRQDSGTFCWTPPLSAVSTLPYYFNLKVSDNSCPIPGYATRSIAVRVKIYAPITGNITNTVVSGNTRQIGFARTDTNSTLTALYQWTVSPTPGAYTSTGASTYTTQSFTHTFPSSGLYVVKLSISVSGAYCDVTRFDTINACLFTTTLGNDITACGSILQTITTTNTGSSGPIGFKWYRLESNLDTLPDSTSSISVNMVNSNNNYSKRNLLYMVFAMDSVQCKARDTVQVTLHKPVTLSGSIHDTTICQGTSITFGFTAQPASSGISYLWSNSKTTSTITEQNASWYVLAALNPDSTCTTSDSVHVQTVAVPAANAGSDQTFCNGTTYQLSGTGGSSQQWFVLGQPTPLTNLNVTPAVQTAYVLKTSNQQNNTTCSNRDTMVLFVVNYPAANAGADMYLCSGNSVTLTGSGGSSRKWFEAGQSTALTSNTVSPIVQTDYQLQTANNLNGIYCYNYDTLTVFTGQKAIITMPTFSPSYCSSLGNVALTGQTPTTGGTGVWTTSKPSCLSNGNFHVGCAGAGTHYVYYTFTTDSFNCVSRDTAIIVVTAMPVISFTTPASTCINTPPFALSAQPAAGGTATWTSSSASCVNSGVFDPACAGLGTHRVFYYFSSGVGCSSFDSTTISVLPVPQTRFSSNITSGNAPLVVLFHDSSTGISGRKWDFGDPSSSGNVAVIKTPAHTYQQGGTYSVSLVTYINTSGTLCYDTLTKTNLISVTGGSGTGIGSVNAAGMRVYPNPARDGFTIEVPEGNYTVQLFDVTGREVWKEARNATQLTIGRNGLATGVYTIRVTNAQHRFTGRIALH